MRKESRYFFYISLIFIGVIIGVIFTSQFSFHQSSNAQSKNAVIDKNFSFPNNSEPISTNQSNDDFSNTFIKINKKVTPSIVSITAVRSISADEIRKFHNRDQNLFERLFPEGEEEFQQGSSGSGIIVHPDGYILTNTHVVKDANQLSIILFDNRTFPGKLIGIDALTEVAVIKIDAEDLPVANLGNSDQLEVGQWVVAIGNPLELRFSLTVGIVSAIGRNMSLIRDNFGIEDFIQTDAVINPGNSGGALVDLNGNVIGVNTAIATRTGYYEGYGFAIPINLAKAIMEDLVTEGRVVRAYLGISMQQMDHLKAKAYGMEKPEGVFVDNLLDDGPAGKAGIQPEDIILSIDDEEVNQSNQVQSMIAQKEPGQKVIVSVYRKGEKVDIPIVLGERETGSSQPEYTSTEPEEPKELGLDVENLNRRKARELGLELTKGVLVTRVKRFSKAAYAGLGKDFVILKVNDKEVDDENEFWQEMGKLGTGDVARLFVQRGASNQTHIFVEIP